ncbi:MAG: mitochondrial fission ELM1 family protein [Rhizomicrobium sp.]
MAARFSTCWVVTDGKAGMESQCLGLAEALGVAPIVKRVVLRTPWRQLSPYLRLGLSRAYEQGSDALAPPWPDILIASGRHSVPASLYVRRESRRAGTRTLTVQIQNPVIAASHFDLVVTPLHDRLSGPNVISTIGALHRVTPERLAADAEALAPQIAHLPRPYVGVLIGGPNAAFRFGSEDMRAFADSLRDLAIDTGASLLVTPSRRTGDIAILRATLADVPAFVWDGAGANPYFGILGLADHLIVTSDSVNMISEACATGRPVRIYNLPGGSGKTRRFQRLLRERNLTRDFEGRLESFTSPRIDEMSTVVDAIRKLA